MNRYTNKNSNGSWVYINGELYHAGIKGMKWGKHLPGTDWWKETTNKYYSQHPNIQSVQGGRQYAAKPTLSTKVKANLSTAGQAAKAYGRIIGSTARTYRDKAIMKGHQVKRAVEKNINKAAYKTRKAVSTGAKLASEFAKRTVSSLKDKAVAGKAKAKQFISSFAKKSVSSIKSNASKTQTKVYKFLERLGIMERVYNNRRPGGAGSRANQVYTKK